MTRAELCLYFVLCILFYESTMSRVMKGAGLTKAKKTRPKIVATSNLAGSWEQVRIELSYSGASLPRWNKCARPATDERPCDISYQITMSPLRSSNCDVTCDTTLFCYEKYLLRSRRGGTSRARFSWQTRGRSCMWARAPCASHGAVLTTLLCEEFPFFAAQLS